MKYYLEMYAPELHLNPLKKTTTFFTNSLIVFSIFISFNLLVLFL